MRGRSQRSQHVGLPEKQRAALHTNAQVEDIVWQQTRLLQNTFWIVNADLQEAHLPATDEERAASHLWTTQCGTLLEGAHPTLQESVRLVLQVRGNGELG